jgi:hypothetical protein
MSKEESHSSPKEHLPELVAEWHPTRNGDLIIQDLSYGSSKKAWWKCEKGEDHEWQAPVKHRSNGTGCPYCSGRRASKLNSLAALAPDLAREWHPTKNGRLGPENVLPQSNKPFWWKCDKGPDHEWKAPPSTRPYKHSGGKNWLTEWIHSTI